MTQPIFVKSERTGSIERWALDPGLLKLRSAPTVFELKDVGGVGSSPVAADYQRYREDIEADFYSYSPPTKGDWERVKALLKPVE